MNVSTDPVNPLTHPRSELAAQHLQKTYGKRTVVKDVSFCVRSGEVVGLLGTERCGQNHLFLHGRRLGRRGQRRRHD